MVAQKKDTISCILLYQELAGDDMNAKLALRTKTI
jgi:hypothetical protein